MESYVLTSLQSVLPAYHSVQSVSLQRMHSGTNTVLKVTAEALDPVIFRKFGSCPLIDRAAEHRTFLRMSASGLGPTCLALGNGFRVEEFLPGNTVDRLEIPNLVEDIAKEIAKLHALESGEGASWLEKSINDWGALFMQRSEEYMDSLSQERKALLSNLRSAFTMDKETALGLVPRRSHLVLSHNDVSYTNVLKHTKGVYLLDYEYSAMNCPASDLATLANEATYDYMAPAPVYFRYCPHDELSENRLSSLITAYCETSRVSEDEIWSDFLKCRAAIHFVGYLWAACMYNPGADSVFDMLRYSDSRLASYRLTLDKLP